MTADKATHQNSWILNRIAILKNHTPLWRSDTTMVDNPAGKEIIKKFDGNPNSMSPAVIKAIIEKLGLSGKSVLEPFVWSPATMLGALATECRYEGVVRRPDIYASVQSIGEGLGASILYGSLGVCMEKKYDVIVLPVPDNFNHKRYLRYVRMTFKMARKILNQGGTLIIKENYLLKGWPEEFKKIKTFWRVGTRVGMGPITENTMAKAKRITTFKSVDNGTILEYY